MVFLLCCAVDLFVLRATWTGRQITEGQFRHGYFERFGGEVGLALDNTIRPLFPEFLFSGGGELGVPPGVTAVAPLVAGTEYVLATDSMLAPYVVIGSEAPLVPGSLDNPLLPGEARLEGGRTLALQDGRLTLVAWDPGRPWREDAARLTGLRAGCDAHNGAAALTVTAAQGRFAVQLGRCSLDEPLPTSPSSPPLLAALAGPDWTTVTRQPGWTGERWVLWPVVAAVVARVAVMWWALGLPSAAAVSAVLLGASFGWPVAAALTWALALAVGVAAAIARAAVLAFRALPPDWRVPVALAALVAAGWVVATQAAQPPPLPQTIMRIHHDSQADACALVGYSTVQGASLRRGRGGIRWYFDEDCARCRGKTAALAAGGETLTWLRDAYCSAPPSFGADGQVIFLGGANDDFLSGVLSLARLFVIGQQGIEPWRRNQAPATAASLARVDAQVTALGALMECIRARGARFLFLHDFLVTDMVAGREPDRAAMLARRRAVVEAAGGTFVDLFDVFGAEAGIAWFNDYVHPSLIAHQRIADLACGRPP